MDSSDMDFDEIEETIHEESADSRNSTNAAQALPAASTSGATGSQISRKRKTIMAGNRTKETDQPSRKLPKSQHADTGAAAQKTKHQTHAHPESNSPDVLAPQNQGCSRIQPIQGFLREMILNFSNTKNSDILEYQNLPPPMKQIYFEAESSVVEIFVLFQVGEDSEQCVEFKLAREKLHSTLLNLKSLAFHGPLSSNFQVTAEMRAINLKSRGIISLSNTEFLKFLEQGFPIIEIISIMKATNAICTSSA